MRGFGRVMRQIALSILLVAGFALVPNACSPPDGSRRADVVDRYGAVEYPTVRIFHGVLASVDGQAISGSHLRLTLFARGDARKAVRYELKSDCDDAGFITRPNDRFFSQNNTPTAGVREDRCTAEEAQRLGRFSRVMEPGAELSGDFKSYAQFSSPAGAVRFAAEPYPEIVD